MEDERTIVSKRKGRKEDVSYVKASSLCVSESKRDDSDEFMRRYAVIHRSIKLRL